MAEKPIVTAPPATDPDTGFALLGDFPYNHRLRAEAIAKAGRKTDPDGIIGDDLIADAKARVSNLKAAEKAQADAQAETEAKAAAKPAAEEKGA